jgi:casein kinase II subunit beta
MYKERSSSLAAEERVGGARGEGSLYREVADNNNNNNKKRLEDGIEKSSPSTSKGGNGREKDRPLAPAASTHTRRFAGHDVRPTLEKAKYPDDGELLRSFMHACLLVKSLHIESEIQQP